MFNPYTRNSLIVQIASFRYQLSHSTFTYLLHTDVVKRFAEDPLTEGIILIARGYEIRNGTDGEYSSALLKVCRGLPEAFRVIADEKQALSILRRTLTSGLETSWNVWQSAERTGSGQGEAETL